MKRHPDSLKQHLFLRLRSFAEQHFYVSFEAIKQHARDSWPDLKDDTLRQYLSDATDKGFLFDAGRSWYSSLSEPAVLDPAPVQPLVNEMLAAFPLLDFTVWATTQLNPWMRHLFNSPLRFVSCPKESLDAVFEFLKRQSHHVWLNPRKPVAASFIPTDRAIILRPLVSKAPSEPPFASVEQVLVDLCLERRLLPILDETEFHQMAERVAFHNRIKISELESYAKRRKASLAEIFPIHYLHNFKKLEIMD